MVIPTSTYVFKKPVPTPKFTQAQIDSSNKALAYIKAGNVTQKDIITASKSLISQGNLTQYMGFMNPKTQTYISSMGFTSQNALDFISKGGLQFGKNYPYTAKATDSVPDFGGFLKDFMGSLGEGAGGFAGGFVSGASGGIDDATTNLLSNPYILIIGGIVIYTILNK